MITELSDDDDDDYILIACAPQLPELNCIAQNEWWTHQADAESQYLIHIKHLLQPIHFVRACLCVLDH